MSKYSKLAFFGVLLSFVVIMLGAYVRLSDAGLGCPDWPGCYGMIDWPMQEDEIAKANQNYPEREVEVEKAAKEVIHRYFAGALGLVALSLLIWAWRRRDEMALTTPVLLSVVVVFQALLGMWTVTLQLKPLIVMAHLLGGLLTMSLFLWLGLLNSNSIQPYRYAGHVKPWMVLLGLVLVVLQIALGGWTSTNYAALACVGFPQCNGQWWPEMNFSEAFVMWRGLGINYEFGVLDAPSRVAIQMTHRIGAIIVSFYLVWMSLKLMKNRELMPLGVLVLVLLTLQVVLGISNVVFNLPLLVATAHNGVAAFLLAAMVILLYKTRRSQ